MSSHRPFFSNFLAIFRTHAPPIPKSASSLTATASTTTSSAQSLWTSAAAAVPLSKQASQTTDKPATSPRPINTKANPYNPATTAPAPLQHNVSPQTHLPRSPSTGSLPMYGPPNKPQPSYPTLHETRRTRRGSDSSSDSGGFREVRSGGEKWYIGGITASGEEKYYKLGMVKRERSADRISADQLSL